MPTLIMIILSIVIIVASNKKNKAKTTQKQQNKSVSFMKNTTNAGQFTVSPKGGAVYTAVNANKVTPAAPNVAEGSSLTDETGCVGGSLPHPAAHEGISFADAAGCVGGSMEHPDRHEGTSFADNAGCVGGSMEHPDRHEGTSFADNAGCVGGSMPHPAGHEGTAYASYNGTYAPKTHTAQRTEAAEVDGSNADKKVHPLVRGLNAKEMRRAVVMSEVLSGPASLR